MSMDLLTRGSRLNNNLIILTFKHLRDKNKNKNRALLANFVRASSWHFHGTPKTRKTVIRHATNVTSHFRTP